MEQVLRHQLLDKANQLFRSVGVGLIHEEQLAAALDLSLTAFRCQFGSKAELILQVTRRNLARQRHEHNELFAHLGTPVECLLALLHHSLHEMRRSPHYDYYVLRDKYPLVWDTIQEYLQHYSLPLLTRLLQEGVIEGQFRADIDAPFIARIMLAQFGLILNEQVFPPDFTNLADVYRNIFFYYVRGICTEEGVRLATSHFVRM
ncbi:MAG: TetR/AcrR family transcriptional regulator [Hymenobacter sp.]|nr:TetR/AcrR family transcriptional regulator [Hymenobacter sp.]